MKILKFKNVILALVITFTMLVACKKEKVETVVYKEGSIQLGKKIPNAYSVSNMRNAYKSLRHKLKTAIPIPNNGRIAWDESFPTEQEMEAILVPTNKYLRILPANEEQYDTLRNLEDVTFFDFPLDYEIVEGEGNFFHDPNLSDSVITWQYVVLQNNENLPSSVGQLETLTNDIFLPENSSAYDEYPEEFWDLLEDEALDLLGLLEDDENAPSNARTQANKWTPSGRIMVLDEQLGQVVPLEGAKVVMKTFWRTATGFTDANGYYTSNKQLRNKVDYSIKWEHDRSPKKWDIRSGFYGQAWTLGKLNSTSSWNATFNTKDLNLFYATIYRATYDVLVKNPFGLTLPSARLKIAGMDEGGTGVNHHIASIVAGPDIKIFRKYDDGYIRNTTIVYGTTAHEIGHSCHRTLGVMMFSTSNWLIKESWANSVEWAYCNWKYNIGNVSNFYSATNVEWFNTEDRLYLTYKNNNKHRGYAYSPLFIDLLDNLPDNSSYKIDYLDNNGNVTSYSLYYFNENIKGYTLKNIQDALAMKGWAADEDKALDDIRTYLVNEYNNPTENNIESYFNVYKDYKYVTEYDKLKE